MEEFKQKGAAVQIRAASAQTELMDRSGVHTEEINTQTGAWTEIVKSYEPRTEIVPKSYPNYEAPPSALDGVRTHP